MNTIGTFQIRIFTIIFTDFHRYFQEFLLKNVGKSWGRSTKISSYFTKILKPFSENLWNFCKFWKLCEGFIGKIYLTKFMGNLERKFSQIVTIFQKDSNENFCKRFSKNCIKELRENFEKMKRRFWVSFEKIVKSYRTISKKLTLEKLKSNFGKILIKLEKLRRNSGRF